MWQGLDWQWHMHRTRDGSASSSLRWLHARYTPLLLLKSILVKYGISSKVPHLFMIYNIFSCLELAPSSKFALMTSSLCGINDLKLMTNLLNMIHIRKGNKLYFSRSTEIYVVSNSGSSDWCSVWRHGIWSCPPLYWGMFLLFFEIC